MLFKNKVKFILLGSVTFSIIAPFILTLNNFKNSKNYSNDIGFNVETIPTFLDQEEIVFGQFKRYKNIYSQSPIPPDPYSDVGGAISSNISKTHINTKTLSINFSDERISINSIEQKINSLYIPLSVAVSSPTKKGEVVSAQLIGNKLWFIVDFDTIGLKPDYWLRLITLDGLPNIPTVSNSSNFEISINHLYAHDENIKQPLVLAPVYEKVGNIISHVVDEVFIYQQNGLISNASAKMTKYTTNNIGKYPTIEKNNQVQLPNDPNARLLSTFIFKNNDMLEYDFGAYHSVGDTNNAKISYSSFKNGVSFPQLYSESVGNLNEIDFKNLMAYPKAIITATGIELFWIYSIPTLNSIGPKVFSTKLNNEKIPLDMVLQPKILDLGKFGGTRDIALITYQDNGNFDDGTLYIPLKYKNPIEPRGSIPGIVNWKLTMDPTYWNDDIEISPFNPIISAFIENIDFPDFTLLNEAINSAVVLNIDVINNEITYLFNYVNKNMQGEYFRQTRSLKQDNLLNLLYNSEIPKTIISKVGEGGVFEYSDLTNSSEILPRIKSVSHDYLVNSIGNVFEIVDNKLNFNKENGYLYPMVSSLSGKFINGIYKLAQPQEITLIQQPRFGFIPLNIDINISKNVFASGDDFAKSVNSNSPGVIGDNASNAIQVTSAYLPSLKSVLATCDDFTGEVNLVFEFVSTDNENILNQIIESINFTVWGFQSQRTIIAVVVPVLLIVIGTILTIIIVFWNKKKKKDMFVALQAGMSLTEKMSGDKEVDPRKVTSTINAPLNKRVPQKMENTKMKPFLKDPTMKINIPTQNPKKPSLPHPSTKTQKKLPQK